jgi:phage head maturation protease
MSFAFTMGDGGIQTWDETGDCPLRIINKVGELYDVSVVTRGAYPTTEAAVRSLKDYRAQKNFHAAALRVRRKMNLEQTLRRTSE